MSRALLAALAVTLLTTAARSAELSGVTMPDRAEVAGRTLALNGMAARTYSILRIKIYVAGLYLERPDRDAAAVLASPAPKLILMRYLQPVDRDQAAAAWEHYLGLNCEAPCRLPTAAIGRFTSLLEPIVRDDTMRLTFTEAGVEIAAGGRPKGTIEDTGFARLLLATFIGEAPTSEEVKQGLLAGGAP